MRDIAKRAGVSAATVCRVLQNHPNVAAGTRSKVQAAADALGYQLNPMVGAWMSHVRVRRAVRYTGTLAWVVEAVVRRFRPRFERTMSAAIPHAAQLGYAVEVFIFEEHGHSALRLGEILRHRGIHGVVLENLPSTLPFEDFPWEAFATVGTFSLDRLHPRLPVIAPDFHRAARLALTRLRAAGHRRIGFFQTPRSATITENLCRDAYLAARSAEPGKDRVPVLECAESDVRTIQVWLEKYRPEAILSNSTLLPNALARLGWAPGKPPVVACLNWNREVHELSKVGGVDYLPERLACATLDTVAAQLRRQFHGLPNERRTILIEGEWRDAAT